VKPYQDITDPALAKALAHPLRTRILAALENRTASPSELSEELDASLGVLSYHVRRLTALGFLKLVKRVPRRGAVEHYYTAVARPRITDDAARSARSDRRHRPSRGRRRRVRSARGAPQSLACRRRS
jgi:DNA-binding transcriptional ArsR family regulator